MREVGMAEVRTQLTQLIDEVRMKQEPILIKDRKRRMAVIVPVELARHIGELGAEEG